MKINRICVFALILGCFNSVFLTVGVSVSENYLKHVPWSTVKSSLHLDATTMSDLKKLTLEKTIPKEKEHSANNYVFYHGQQRQFIILYDMMRLLYELFHEEVVENFQFLRVQKDLYATTETAQEFLKRNNYKINDHLSHMKKILLSTNLTFPGNLTLGEGAFAYYAQSKSITSPNFRALVERFLRSLYPAIMLSGEGAAFVNSIENRIQDLRTIINSYKLRYGLLQQIFIPKSKVEDYAYRSSAGGSVPWFFEGLSLKKTLVLLEKYPVSLKYYIRSVQSRIILRKDVFGDPKSGIKIYTYHNIPKNVLDEYRVKLLKIVNDIFSFWSKRHRAELERQFPGKKLKEHYQLYKEKLLESKLKNYAQRTNWTEKKAEKALLAVLGGMKSTKEEVRKDSFKALQAIVSEGFGFTIGLKMILQGLRDKSPEVQNEARELFKILAKKGIFKSVRRYGPRMAKQGLIKSAKAASFAAVAFYGALLARSWYTGDWATVEKINKVLSTIGGYGRVGIQHTLRGVQRYAHWSLLLLVLMSEQEMATRWWGHLRKEKLERRTMEALALGAILFRELNLRDILKLPGLPFSKELKELISDGLGRIREGIALKGKEIGEAARGLIRRPFNW